MKNNNLTFRMAARCEAAGRPNNEDNYQVDSNLTENQWGFTADKEIDLGEKGALLVVCDGMGGMNAGEVASAIAVQTIKECFAAEKLTENVLANPGKYVASCIVAADAAIKADAKVNPEHEGMGSTIVMAWMLGKKAYVGWCGDSRCYCYNPKTGLVRLSHDHSYVQELVDAGKLTEELAFDHPNSNIITRSLGDPSGAARPDVKEYDLHNEDILLLCSDGLCGCLRDNEIEEQVAAHQTSMQECRDALWVADEAAGWHDNVTIVLAQVLSGGAAVVSAGEQGGGGLASNATLAKKNRNLKIIIALLLVLIVCGGGCWLLRKPIVGICERFHAPQDTTIIAPTDTVQVREDVVERQNTETTANGKKGSTNPPAGTEQKENPLDKLQKSAVHVDPHVEGVVKSEKAPDVEKVDNSEKANEDPKEESASPEKSKSAAEEQSVEHEVKVVGETETSVTVQVK